MPLEYDESQLSIYLKRIKLFKVYSKGLAIIVIVLGVLAVLGWFLNLPVLRGEFLGYPGTKLNSAFIFITAGSALYLLNIHLNSKQKILPRILAVVVLIWGGLTLLEYTTGVNFGLDQIFANFVPGQLSVLSKSRILSAFNFVLLGTALLMATYQYKIRWMQIIAFICGFIGLLGLLSYFYGYGSNYPFDIIAKMALLSSLLHIFLSVGLLCLFPDKSYMGRVTAENSGGYMARRLLPTTLGSVFILGILIKAGNNLFLYSEDFGDVFTLIITMIFLLAIIYWNALMLNRMDQKRQESNQKHMNIKKFYENLVEGINEGIWVSDKNDKLYFMNQGMEDLTGVSTEKMKNLDILNDLPDETTGELKKYYKKAKNTLKPVYYDSISVTNPKGRRSYQSGWIIPQIYKGEFNGAICTVIDQTQRREAEDALLKSETYYKTIFENTGTATIIVSEDGTITSANKRCEPLTGYKVDEIRGKMTWMDFVHPDDLEMMKKIHKMRRDPESNAPSEYEFRLIDRNKNVKQIMLSASLIPGTKDSVISLLDITERKNSEMKIKQSLKEKELLLREIHHRVKNNMQIISSLLNLQRSYINDDEADNLLQESQGRVKSMALVHEKLYQTTDLARINIAEYIRSLSMNLFHSYSVKAGINLRLDVGEVFFGIDTAVPLGLIINELVSNSLKYAFQNQEEGQIMISLHEHPDNQTEGQYLLTVKDDGIGFPDNLDFRNTHSLGLQLVNTLVNQLDGTIELVKNKGTCFKIIFQEQKYKERV
ncbi:MAG: PAS domain S-box protein [Methanobacteriaceae archaeon]|nr:PAS domain S-box protein [Methanobacteriaceae archaeon]